MNDLYDEDFDNFNTDPEWLDYEDAFGAASEEFEDQTDQIPYEERGSSSFLPTTKIHSITELFIEWFLLDSSKEKNVAEFIADENISEIITEQDFSALIAGDAILSEPLCHWIAARNPFSLNSQQIIKMNRTKSHGRIVIEPNESMLIGECSTIYKEKNERKKEKKRERMREWHKNKWTNNPEYRARHSENQAKYYQNNKEKILGHIKKYYAENREKILNYVKEYNAKNKEELSAKKAEFYKTPHGKALKAAEYQRNKETYRKFMAAYYSEHREELLADQAIRYENNKDIYLAQYKQYYTENRDDILEKRRHKYAENREAECAKKREWNAANRDKVRARRKESYEHKKDKIREKNIQKYAENCEAERVKKREWYAANHDKIRIQRNEAYASKKAKKAAAELAEKTKVISQIIGGLLTLQR
jgi:hypothetical protein